MKNHKQLPSEQGAMQSQLMSGTNNPAAPKAAGRPTTSKGGHEAPQPKAWLPHSSMGK